jgi:DNA replication factor GINS
MELITYETIRNVHRAEKEEQLQKLPPDFFESVRNWMAHKEKMKDTVSLLEIENAKKLVEDIINRREKKVVMAALRTMRGDLPPQNLTKEERKLFDEIVRILKSHREKMKEVVRDYSYIVEEKVKEAKESIKNLKVEEKVEKKDKFIKPNGKLLVKILSDLPRFVGSDLKAYGPLKAGDLILLPEEIGRLLISRRVAENIME